MAKSPVRPVAPAPDTPAPESVEAAAAPALRVRALEVGYYEHARRRPGDVFVLTDAKDFAPWMEEVDADTPLRLSTPRQVLRRYHDEEQAARLGGLAPASATPTGAADPLGGTTAPTPDGADEP